jgi:hypothetical protein
MGLRDTNPLIDQDLVNIISAYTKGANAQDTEQSVYAVLTPETIDSKTFAENVIDQLNSYNERRTNAADAPSFTFAGLEVQNTAVSIADADSVGEALTIAAADCIPCEDRILALLNLNPLDDLMDLLNNDLSRRYQVLFSLLDLLNNVDIFNDICELLRQLNFFCVPDLQRIAFLLTLLLHKYKDKLDLTISLPEALIGNLFAPFLSGLNALLDQYVQMIIAPIECIIDELNFQLQKLDITEGIAEAEQQLGVNKDNPRNPEGSIPDISDPLKGAIVNPLQSALFSLTDYLKQGKSYIDSSLSFVRDQLLKLLDTSFINTDIKMAAAQNKLHLLRLISLVVSIINATKAGELDCGDLEDIDASKKLQTFLKNYITPNSTIRFNFDESKQEITVQSPAIDGKQSTNIAEIIQNSNQDLPLTSGSRIVDGQLVRQEANILIKNCLRDVAEQDVAKVQEWISEFEKGEV